MKLSDGWSFLLPYFVVNQGSYWLGLSTATTRAIFLGIHLGMIGLFLRKRRVPENWIC